MEKIIIIITSGTAKTVDERFIAGSEWVKGWGFNKDNKMAIRSNNKIMEYNEYKTFYCDLDKNTNIDLIWINGENTETAHIRNFFEKIQNKKYEINIAYHDTIIMNYVIPQNLLGKAKHYSLENSNIEKFEYILSNMQFNKNASFSYYENVFLKSPVEIISFFKHQIAHIFLSIDMDLQRIKDVAANNTGNSKAIEYLKDILNEKSNTHYRQKLADLQFMITDKSDAEHENDTRVKSTLTRNDLPDQKNLLEVIEDKRHYDTVKKNLRTLLELSGLREEKNGECVKLSADSNSKVSQFMVLMDKKMEKCSFIGQADISAILKFFKSNGSWEIKDEDDKPIQINSFHDWFCALDKCLDELRKRMNELKKTKI